MRLDALLAFENIGPDGALRQKLHAVHLARFFRENFNELSADNLALLFGVGHAGQLVQEAIRSVHINQVRVHLVAENLDHLFRFALAQQAVVDMHAEQLLADRLDQQRGHDGRIHAAGQRQQHFLVAHLRANVFNLLLNENARLLGGGNTGHIFRTVQNRHGYQLRSLKSKYLIFIL